MEKACLLQPPACLEQPMACLPSGWASLASPILVGYSPCWGLAGEAVCTAITSHLQDHCHWHQDMNDKRQVGRQRAGEEGDGITAVHFKGPIKPWRGGGTSRRGATSWRYCQQVPPHAISRSPMYLPCNFPLTRGHCATVQAGGDGRDGLCLERRERDSGRR